MNLLGPAPESEPLLEDKGLLSDQIRRALADEIATGRLKPGTALDEQQIATRFGASQRPRCGRRCASLMYRVWWKSGPGGA